MTLVYSIAYDLYNNNLGIVQNKLDSTDNRVIAMGFSMYAVLTKYILVCQRRTVSSLYVLRFTPLLAVAYIYRV